MSGSLAGRMWGALRGGAGKATRAAGSAVGKAPPTPASFQRGFGANLLDQAKTQAIAGAGFGGVMGAGIGALTADPEHRLEGALRGGAGGALTGAVGGLATAPITAAARTGRLAAMDKILPGVSHPYQPGAMKGTGTAAVDAIHAASPLQNIKDAWKHRGTAFGRANALEAAAVPVTLGAEMYLGNKLLESVPQSMGGMKAPEQGSQVGPAPQQMPQQSPQQGAYVGQAPQMKTGAEEAPEPIPGNVGTQIGGLTGMLSGELLARYLESGGHLHEKSFGRFALPAVAGTAGTLAGLYGLRAINEARGATP